MNVSMTLVTISTCAARPRPRGRPPDDGPGAWGVAMDGILPRNGGTRTGLFVGVEGRVCPFNVAAAPRGGRPTGLADGLGLESAPIRNGGPAPRGRRTAGPMVPPL